MGDCIGTGDGRCGLLEPSDQRVGCCSPKGDN
jgi:hypothetical protein